MAIKLVKPDYYAICAGCGTTSDVDEYQFQTGSDSIKVCLALCKPCVYHMADMIAQDTVNKLEAKNDKRPENN